MKSSANSKSRNRIELQSYRSIIILILTFSLSLGIFFFFITNQVFVELVVNPYSAVNAWAASNVLNIAGVRVESTGTFMAGGHGGGVTIGTGCNGLEAMVIYLSAVLAFPAGWKRKVVGCLFGVIGIFAINIVRIIGLFFVSEYWSQQMDAAHIYIGQTVVIVLTIGIFLFWMEGNAKPAE